MPPMLHTCEFDGKIHIDLGCGYGRTLIYTMLKYRPQLSIGVDLALIMLRQAREYACQYGINPILVRGDICTLPLKSSMVEFVYSSGVLFHIERGKVREVVREVARVLRKEGTVVFERSFPGWLNPDGFQTRVITGLFSNILSPAWVRTYSYQQYCGQFSLMKGSPHES
jgi:ubiquinone/menaquinone biosynthesis C-methylase UbiE